MQFEKHTDEENALNEQAAKVLVPGKYYTFEPAVKATGIPIGGPNVCKPQVLPFIRGWYMGYQNEQHVFQGKPDPDPRKINDKLRECYYHVDFTGGSKYSLDQNQKP